MNNAQQRSPAKTAPVLINEYIRTKHVRLIDETGTNVGVIETYRALQRSRNLGLDLYVVNSQADPPIAKILDYNKFSYDQKIQQKEQARKNRENEIVTKEIQLRPVTSSHDIQIKAKHALEFLEDSNRVKIVVKFRGREMNFSQKGFDVINEFIEQLQPCKIDKAPMLAGNSIMALVSTVKAKKAD